MYKKILKVVDSLVGRFGSNDFMTGNICCFLEQDEIIDILECEILSIYILKIIMINLLIFWSL